MLDDFKLFLPKYLSTEAEEKLFDSLKDFPNNIDQRIYTSSLNNTDIIYQGDGLSDMLIINLPSTVIKPEKGIVLSNTCDIDLTNSRNFESRIMYAPIFNLNKYKTGLLKQKIRTEEQILSHINDIQRQRITQIFYLPKIENCIDESMVFLDRVCNINNSLIDRRNLSKQRLFTLSDYGSYLFVFKLSLHFSRIQDKVERGSSL